jgi:hypothetical protein
MALWGSYHNHKELMAWGATALFLTGATARSLAKLPRYATFPCFDLMVFLALIVFTEVKAIRFVFWQLCLREEAANEQMACGILAVRWISSPPERFDLELVENEDGQPMLQAVRTELGRLPKRRSGHDPRLARRITISLMAMWGIAALVRVVCAGLASGAFRPSC